MLDMLKPENRTGLTNLTPADGDNPLDGVAILEIGAAWDVPEADKSAKGWVRRAKKSALGETSDSDADAIAILYVGDKPVKYVGLNNTDPFHGEREGAGSATSTGDNRTGAGEGDDETLRFDLTAVPARITKIMITVGAFKKGSEIRQLGNLITTVYDSTGGVQTPVAFIEPTLYRPKRILAVAALDRVPGGYWTLRVIDTSFDVTPGSLDSLLEQSVAAARRR